MKDKIASRAVEGSLLDDEISEEEWLYAIAHNPAFDFLKDPAEDIYSVQDGKPFTD